MCVNGRTWLPTATDQPTDPVSQAARPPATRPDLDPHAEPHQSPSQPSDHGSVSHAGHVTTVVQTLAGARFAHCTCDMTWELFPGTGETCPIADAERDYADSEQEARAYRDARILRLRYASACDAVVLRGLLTEWG